MKEVYRTLPKRITNRQVQEATSHNQVLLNQNQETILITRRNTIRIISLTITIQSLTIPMLNLMILMQSLTILKQDPTIITIRNLTITIRKLSIIVRNLMNVINHLKLISMSNMLLVMRHILSSNLVVKRKKFQLRGFTIRFSFIANYKNTR